MNNKIIQLENIKNPDIVKTLNKDELDALSMKIREYLLEKISINGGHLASNLADVEATISLLRSFDFTKDRLIFDVGHQCYTYKILTGRSLTKLRKKDGISGFQKRKESPFDHYEAGHSSTSIGAANGMAIARRLNKQDYHIVVFIGDAAINNGLTFEALFNIHDKIIIVLNDNTENGVNLDIYKGFGLKVYPNIDGHNILEMDNFFKKAEEDKESVLIHIRTIKGKGYLPSENNQSGKYHSVPPFDLSKGLEPSSSLTWSNVYRDLLAVYLANNDKLFLLTAATANGSSLDELIRIYPDKCRDFGINEEDVLITASGLASQNYHPVISLYSTFLQRGYDEISHDLARMNLSSTLLIDRAGIVGEDGNTHQGIYDEAFLYSIPNVTISMASNIKNSRILLEESFKEHGPFVIRYPRETVKYSGETSSFKYGEWVVEKRSNPNIAIVSYGPVVEEIKDYADKNNIPVTLFNAIYQRPMDETKIKELLQYKRILIFTPYATKEGFAQTLISSLMLNKYQGEVSLKCLPTAFIDEGSIMEIRKDLGLLVSDIFENQK